MAGDIKVCVDRILSEEQMMVAAQKALEENPANAPIVSFAPSIGVPIMPPPFLALITGKKWRNGRTLQVRFLDGSPAMQAKVEQYAHRWSAYANINFAFGSSPTAEIRVSFQQEGSWSHIGTDALGIPKNQPTVNFGWLREGTADEEYSRVVTHEFGHALGCIHEHQNPVASVPWDKEAVYRYYAGPPNNWSRDQVDLNLFQKYSRDITQFSKFDKNSIMLYAIPNQFTIGDFEVGWNTHLSETDTSFIETMYPPAEKPITDLAVGAAPVQADIGKHGEEDLYRFGVPEKGHYIIETEGHTDVVMALFGPDSRTKLRAQDDDSGRWLNARIAAVLERGTYYVRIRHFRPTSTGKYQIWVEAVA